MLGGFLFLDGRVFGGGLVALVAFVQVLALSSARLDLPEVRLLVRLLEVRFSFYRPLIHNLRFNLHFDNLIALHILRLIFPHLTELIPLIQQRPISNTLGITLSQVVLFARRSFTESFRCGQVVVQN